jgi:hypothetical protein
MATAEKKTRQQVAIPDQEPGGAAWSEAERLGPLGPDRARATAAQPPASRITLPCCLLRRAKIARRRTSPLRCAAGRATSTSLHRLAGRAPPPPAMAAAWPGQAWRGRGRGRWIASGAARRGAAQEGEGNTETVSFNLFKRFYITQL